MLITLAAIRPYIFTACSDGQYSCADTSCCYSDIIIKAFSEGQYSRVDNSGY